MFVVSQRNIILPGPNGEKFPMPKGFMGSVPSWAENSAYLQALAADGKVIISAGSKDKDIEDAGKKRRRSKDKKPTELAEMEPSEQAETEPPKQAEDPGESAPAGEQSEGT